MAVLFKLHKIVRKFNDGREDAANNRWYAKAFHLGTVETDELAEEIQENCSVKKSDVKAVIEELIGVMTKRLQQSYAVKLNGLGTFKLAIVSSNGADTVEEFSVQGNIKGAKVNFTPATTIDATRKRTQALVKGVRFAETKVYKVERQK